MSVLYTPKQIQEALRELRIKPETKYGGDMVTGQEAARILTWRAKHEQGVEHNYLDSALRRHVQQKHIKPYPVNSRLNMYKVDDVFALSLVPKRGAGLQKKREEAVA